MKDIFASTNGLSLNMADLANFTQSLRFSQSRILAVRCVSESHFCSQSHTAVSVSVKVKISVKVKKVSGL